MNHRGLRSYENFAAVNDSMAKDPKLLVRRRLQSLGLFLWLPD